MEIDPYIRSQGEPSRSMGWFQQPRALPEAEDQTRGGEAPPPSNSTLDHFKRARGCRCAAAFTRAHGLARRRFDATLVGGRHGYRRVVTGQCCADRRFWRLRQGRGPAGLAAWRGDGATKPDRGHQRGDAGDRRHGYGRVVLSCARSRAHVWGTGGTVHELAGWRRTYQPRVARKRLSAEHPLGPSRPLGRRRRRHVSPCRRCWVGTDGLAQGCIVG